jgi:hypothetical protein
MVAMVRHERASMPKILVFVTVYGLNVQNGDVAEWLKAAVC